MSHFYLFTSLDVRPEQKVSISYKYSRIYPYQASIQDLVKKLCKGREPL